jgi:hypothetical protein
VPEISRFFGIMITMNYNDHNPPHFHARYGSAEALLTIEPFGVYSGELPPRVLGLVTEWAALHRAELSHDWSLARSMKPLNRIPPLE